MADEPTPSTQAAEAPTQSEAPTDFREYAAWRATGELPQKDEPATPAAAEATEPAPATTAPDSEPDEDQEQDTAENAKPGSRRSRKIERLTREVEELKRALSGHAPDANAAPKPPQPAQTEGKPKLEDFQTLEEFQESLTIWIYDEREKAKAAAEAKRVRETAERDAFDAWSKREKAAKKAHDDYEDIMESVRYDATLEAVPDVRRALLESELGAEIFYHLAKHPSELHRIIALSPHSAVREIGKLEAALTKPSAPEINGNKITGAPKPPPPTGRPSKTTTDSLDDPEVIRDYSKWEKLRMAQLRSK